MIWSGNTFDVWQRPPGSQGVVKEHLGLGTSVDPASVPKCSDVQRLAREAGPNGRLAAVARDPVAVVPLPLASYPVGWKTASEFSLVPTSAGAVSAQVHVPTSTTYDVWLGGQGGSRPQTELTIDGHEVSSVGELAQNDGDYVHLASIDLKSVTHDVSIYLHGTGASLDPGSGALRAPIGPLTISDQEAADTKVTYFHPSQANQLCGKRWDWIEALSKRPG